MATYYLVEDNGKTSEVMMATNEQVSSCLRVLLSLGLTFPSGPALIGW